MSIQEGQLEKYEYGGHYNENVFKDTPTANVTSVLPLANILNQIGS
jgi:hypothetical protein